MSTIAPPSSPLMAVPAQAEPDDITDPPVPPGVLGPTPVPDEPPATAGTLPDALLPLAHGFCQYVQAQLDKQLHDAGIKMMRSLDTSITAMADYTKGVLATNEHAHYSFADALAKIQAGAAPATPYTAIVEARTPHGFPLRLTIEKATSGELIEELGRLEGWLVAHGYTVAEVAA